jgi:hypothetical protein
LLIEISDMRREEAVKAKRVAFLGGESGALIQARRIDQVGS